MIIDHDVDNCDCGDDCDDRYYGSNNHLDNHDEYDGKRSKNDQDDHCDDCDDCFNNQLDNYDGCDNVLDVKFQVHLVGLISLGGWLG